MDRSPSDAARNRIETILTDGFLNHFLLHSSNVSLLSGHASLDLAIPPLLLEAKPPKNQVNLLQARFLLSPPCSGAILQPRPALWTDNGLLQTALQEVA